VTAWYLIPLAIDAATTAMLLAQGRFTTALLPLSLGAITLMGSNLALDPNLGAVGAAAARLAGQFVASAVNIQLTLRGWGGLRLWRQLAGVALSGCLLIGALLLPLPAMAGILVGAVVYVAACFMTGVVTPVEGRLVFAMLARRP
jgi:O-antigen/teichoic acid export membrane protein